MWFEQAAEFGWAILPRKTRRRAAALVKAFALTLLVASAYRVAPVDRLVQDGFRWYVNEKAQEAEKQLRKAVEKALPAATSPESSPKP
jgi:hypothetical protein